MNNTEISFSIESKFENVALLGKSINSIASSLKLSIIESHKIELSIVEAVNNIIEHGYNSLPGNYININLRIENNLINFKISDKGITNVVKPKTVLDYNPNDIPNLPERGFGTYLIYMMMDSIKYETIENVNILTLTKKIS